jgi:hypothetical protein
VEIVKGPDGPSGPHGKSKGVVEFFEVMKLDTPDDQSEYEKALLAYIEKYKDQPLAILTLANYYSTQGNNDKTLELIKKADTTNPG